MAEDRYCKIHFRNRTGNVITLQGSGLSWGKWPTSPPTQIANGSDGFFHACGAKGSATGTEGWVTYTLPDNATTATINFDIPYSSANSGGMSMSGTGMSQYSGNQYDSSFTNIVSFPTSGNGIEVYFMVALQQSKAAAVGPRVFHFDVTTRLGQQVAAPTVNIADVARLADCGEVPSDLLVKLFQGNTSATAVNILAAPGIPAGTLVQFFTKLNMLAPASAFAAALDCAANVASVLSPNPEVYEAVQELLTLLRKLSQTPTGDPSPITALVDKLEDAKAVMLAQVQRGATANLISIAAIESVLCCAYQTSSGALAQASSCARDTATDEAEYDKISQWQLQYLQKLVASS
jgi:hypothetical protein